MSERERERKREAQYWWGESEWEDERGDPQVYVGRTADCLD